MIAAVTQKFSLNNLTFDWFDVALGVVLIFGLWRGRKNGMTKEVLPTAVCLTLMLACGLLYPLLADVLLRTGALRKIFGPSTSEATIACVISYIFIAIIVFIIFSIIKKSKKAKLEGSNFFGSAEYYLGMFAGMIRYAAILMIFLAFLNAPVYSAAEIEATKAYNQRWYGGGIMTGDYVPDLQTVQASVFKKSFTGPLIKKYVSVLLIDSDKSHAHKAPVKTPIIHIGS
jgi:uncharacterized membrane protein required for colicin V production